MSHFSLLVITDEKPTADHLATVLQPWHEYECTGVEDQYVVDVDVTDQANEGWAEIKEVVRFPDGRIINRYSSELYTKDTGRKDIFGKPELEFELPPGCTIDKVTQAELSAAEGESFEQWAKGYGGWFRRGDRFFDRTNPNKKWDWWMVGGRWTGTFKPHYDPDKDPSKREVCFLCLGTGTRPDMAVANGCNGCQGSGTRTTWPTQWTPMESDQLQVKDVPVAELRAIAEQKAAKDYDAFHGIRDGRPIIGWDAMCEKHLGNIQAARDEYHAQPALKDILATEQFKWLDDPENYDCDRATFIKRAGDGALATFAVVKDGQWHERGGMGWWGVVHEKDRDSWNAEFARLIEGLPPTAWLTIVDCHI